MKSVRPENIIIGFTRWDWSVPKKLLLLLTSLLTSHSDENIHDHDSKVTSADHIAHILSDNFELDEAGTVSGSCSPIHSRSAKKRASAEEGRQNVGRKYRKQSGLRWSRRG